MTPDPITQEAATARALARGRVVTYPSREEWQRDRCSGPPDFALGATDVAAILGKGWRSAWDVWSAAHTQGVESEGSDDGDVLSRGREMEPIILAQYARTRRVATHALLSRAVHRTLKWLRPSPDAYVLDLVAGEIAGGWEGKTDAYGDGWGEDGTLIQRWDADAIGVVPPGYALQVYALLAASSLPWWDVTVAIPMRGKFLDYRTIRFERDEETQGAIVEEVAAWRDRHLVGGEEPPIDASSGCGEHLARRFAGGAKSKRPASAEEAALVDEYAELGRRKDEIEERRKLLSHQIQEAIGADYGGLVLDAGPKSATAIVVRVAGRRTVALKDVETKCPELAVALAEAGLVNTGAPSAHIRTYGY